MVPPSRASMAECRAMAKDHGLAPADLFDVDSLLSDEERAAKRTVARFVEDRFMPVVQKHFRAATFPMELIPELAKLGCFGMNLHGYGCAGMTNTAYGA